MSAAAPAPGSVALPVVKRERLRIPIAKLHPSPLNPRTHFDPVEVEDVGISLVRDGQFTSLIVREHPKKKGEFEIAAGETRWRAAKLKGLDVLECDVEVMTEERFQLILNVENLKHRQMRPLEEARSYRNLKEQLGWSDERIAEVRHVPVKYVTDRLRLFKLTPDATKLLESGRIVLGHALELAKLGATDQGRAIREGLWEREAADASPYVGELEIDDRRKARSVDELRTWINDHVRVDLSRADAGELFPEAVPLVIAARAEKRKIVAITHDHYVQPEARGGARILGPRSWKRADGQHGTKPCPSSDKTLGVVEAGAGAGEAFPVCIDKKGCRVHWGSEIAAAKKAAAGGGKTNAADAERRRRAAEDRRVAEEGRKTAALHRVLVVLYDRAEKVIEEAPIGGRSVVGQWLFAGARDRRRSEPAGSRVKKVKVGADAESLVRALATIDMIDTIESMGRWVGDLPRLKKFCKEMLRLDVDKLMAAELAKLPAAKVLKCRYCGCTETTPCRGGCSWVETDPPRCSAPPCVAAHEAAVAGAKKKADALVHSLHPKKGAAKAPAKKAAVSKPRKREPKEQFMAPVQPDAVLAAVVGSKPLPRTELTKKLWAYIKREGLQQKKNRRMINTDAKLRPVFGGKDAISMFDMTKAVSKHLVEVKK